MGWSGGTDIFDEVVGELLTHEIPQNVFESIVDVLLSSLEDKDWDNVCESEYFYYTKLKDVLESHGYDFEDEDE